MAVAFDAVTTHAGDDNDFTHTPSGTPTLVVVTCHRRQADATSEVTGITYNSVALARHTYIDSKGATAPGVSSGVPSIVEVWYLESPSAGAQTVSVTTTGTDDQREVYAAWTFTGTSTSGALGTVDTDYGSDNTDTSCTGTVTGASDGMVFDALVTEEDENHTIVAGQTERFDLTDGSAFRGCGSTEPGAASVSCGWTWTTSTRMAYVVVPIGASSAAQAPAAPTNCSATASGDSITATFTDNTSGAAQHRAYYRRTSDEVWTVAGDLEAAETSFVFEWLTANTDYTVAFTSFDSDAESAMTTDTALTAVVRLVSGSFL